MRMSCEHVGRATLVANFACAAALAVLEVFEDEQLVARAVRLGAELREALVRLQAEVPAIGDVRGLGCMLAVELVKDRQTKEPDADLADRIIIRARERGLLLLKCGPYKNVVRFLPPLTATSEEIAQGAERLRFSFSDVSGTVSGT
jgi:4-aminobutyrate aminotransferase/(S)-3-amino-2-methylpropionate transaminase